MTTLTVQDIIDQLIYLRDHTTVLGTTETNVVSITNSMLTGRRMVTLEPSVASLIEQELRADAAELEEDIRALEDEVDSLKEELREYRYQDGRRSKDDE